MAQKDGLSPGAVVLRLTFAYIYSRACDAAGANFEDYQNDRWLDSLSFSSREESNVNLFWVTIRSGCRKATCIWLEKLAIGHTILECV